MHRLATLGAVPVLAIVCCATAGGSGLLRPGNRAPQLTGRYVDGRTVRLSDVRGHVAVVYFYPKDETPGCTREACAFRDAFDRFSSAGIHIFGVSRDSEEDHREFQRSHHLPFALVSDESGRVAQRYGVSSFLGMTERVTFLVDRNGNIGRVFPDVDPAVHAEEVLKEARRIGGAR